MFTRIHTRGLISTTALVTSLIITPQISFAQDGTIVLDEISVSTILDTISDATTKTDDKVIDTLAGVSVVNKKQLDQFQPGRPSEMLAAVPGVSVQEDSDDPGSSINIRGLQDFGRVNVMIDGARQNFQRSGHNANGQFYLEPEMIKQIDIVRGPISTIYGSGAIGGVVNFRTIDPEDMLRNGETWAASVKGQYNTNDKGKLVSTIGAVKLTDYISILGNMVYRDNDNYTDGADNEIFETGEEIVSGLVKAVINISKDNKVKLSYMDQKFDFVTGNTGSKRETETKDQTWNAKWTYNPSDNALIDLSASTYFTNTDMDQQQIDGSSQGAKRNFKIETLGFDIFNSSRFENELVKHTVTYGGDYFKDEVETEDLTGNGDEFTPSGERLAYGLFIQEKLEYSDWLEIIGALRYDAYELNSIDGKENSEGDRISPKVTVGITPFTGVQFYASYSEGYRAPAITETFQSGIHPGGFAFEIVPNSALKPETAENLEIGANLKFDNIINNNDAFRLKTSLFRNDIENYIGTKFSSPGPNCSNGFGCYQYLNINQARLEGFELEANYDAKFMYASIAYSHIRGKDLTSKEHLLTISPDKFVGTLGFRFLEEKLVVGGRWTAVAAQNRVPTGTTESESYNLFDLFATYEVNDNFSTALTLKNISDQHYTRYLNSESDAEPGFSALISATIRFGS